MSQSYCCVIKLKQPKTGRIKKKIKDKRGNTNGVNFTKKETKG